MDGRFAGGEESLDLIEAFAFPLPITVICELLGVPAAGPDKFQVWSHAVVSSVVTEEEFLAAGTEMFSYFTALLAAKRRSPADDLTSALIAARDSGDSLDEQKLIALLFLLLVAGHETTTNLIATGTLALLRYPAELARLRGDWSLLPAAVEELLRYSNPLNHTTDRFADGAGGAGRGHDARRATPRLPPDLRAAGIPAIPVEASSGSMGGSDSTEFMCPSASGEDLVAYSPACGYAANLEKATSRLADADDGPGLAGPERFDTPGARTIEDLATRFGAPAGLQIKDARLRPGRSAHPGADARGPRTERAEAHRRHGGSGDPPGAAGRDRRGAGCSPRQPGRGERERPARDRG